MPKEVVARIGLYADGESTVVETDELSVVWGHDSVQVLIKNTYADPSKDFEQYSTCLSRQSINDMILALRKARDRVYGKDA